MVHTHTAYVYKSFTFVAQNNADGGFVPRPHTALVEQWKYYFDE